VEEFFGFGSGGFIAVFSTAADSGEFSRGSVCQWHGDLDVFPVLASRANETEISLTVKLGGAAG